MTTLLEEMFSAARGMWALLRADRRSSDHFDLTLRGLAGSAIAFLLVSVLSVYLPALAGGAMAPGVAGRALLLLGIPVVAQIAVSALALRQIKRFDGFVPYLVVDNWLTVFGMAVSGVAVLFGLGPDIVLLAVGIASLVVKVNYSRLILTLGGWQVAMFLVAQLVGGAIGLLLMAPFLSLPPDLAAAAGAPN